MARQYFATPFIVAEKSDTTEVKATLATGSNNPFTISVNSGSPAKGTYAGVLVTPANGTSSFQNVSFTLRGSDTLHVTVRYKHDGKGAYNFTTLAVSAGSSPKASRESDAYRVTLSARAFRIPAGSTIDKIIVSPDTSYGANTFLISDLRVNGESVSKDLKAGTQFFPVINGISPGAPLADFTSFASSGSSNVRITNLAGATGSSQLIFLQNYGGNSIALIDHVTKQPIALTFVTGTSNIYYFTLNKNQTAEYVGYSASAPFHCSIYTPISSATNSSNVSAGSTAYCSATSGVTLVEPNVSGTAADTIDISEVSGVNAHWEVALPCGWVTGAYLSPGSQQYIPVSTIKNRPGASPYYGDYGNPGVYPFGCSSCASRYNYEVYSPGCSSFTYPANDVGCDNAINYYPNNTSTSPTLNPPNPVYESPPPGVSSLPIDQYAPKKIIYNLSNIQPLPALGYGICQLSRSTQCSGGVLQITLRSYP
jgi:hypothetical protein